MLRQSVLFVLINDSEKHICDQNIGKFHGFRTCKIRYCFYLRQCNLSFPAGKSEDTRLLIGETHAQASLEENLTFRKKLFLVQDKPKGLSTLVVLDVTWNISQLLPVSKDVA